MLTKLIPTKVHAALDYTVGVLLIAAPWIFGFADESTAATWMSVLAGLAIIGISTVTNYEGGFLGNLVAMRTHLISDGLLGVFLAASPWLFGFAEAGTNAWLPFVAIGAGEILSAAATNPMPGDRSHRAREARRVA
jgi:hypothetical protein